MNVCDMKRWLTVAALALLAACGKQEAAPAQGQAAPAQAAAEAFTVLATSDLKDVQGLEEMVQKATGVPLKFRFGGTMESTEAVLSGEAKADAAEPANEPSTEPNANVAVPEAAAAPQAARRPKKPVAKKSKGAA